MRYLLTVFFILFLIKLATGSGNLPPQPVCKSDPTVNSTIESKIKDNCHFDCDPITSQYPSCMSDCATFSKWGNSYIINKEKP